MSTPEPTITVAVDPTNPGQFFACCGLLELAARLWPDVDTTGWFERDQQRAWCFKLSSLGTLADLLSAARGTELANAEVPTDDDDEESEDDDDSAFVPLDLVKPVRLRIDWFQDKSLKPWAGSMKANLITRAMCEAINPADPDPLHQSHVVYDPPALTKTGRSKKPKKREPFYFDSRRGANATAIDIGFMPDKIKTLKTHAQPAVEFFALVGLQRCRPKPTDTPRVFDYFTWSRPCGPAVLPLAVNGLLGDPLARGFRFENAFRTGQKKHKAFNPATPLGGAR